ncbi:MAG: hypothetical protein AAF485_21165 [Chloroflexota bacterium]
MSTDSKIYQAYLIRCSRQDETLPWRIMFQESETLQKHYFASLKEAFEFLTVKLAANPASVDITLGG